MNKQSKKIDVVSIYESNVFSDQTMKERLPKETYKTLKKIAIAGTAIPADVADVIANAMKDWAIENGATHYTHWFQPLTGKTAEKHDSFISPSREGGVVMEFSGKQLSQGEPDASSFPNGGLRVTFEARGYTAWDATSPAFLKEDSSGNVTLCIPTAFCSYNGEALDKKTPLLRSMKSVSNQAIRVLKLLGNTTSQSVMAEAGPEQEYFLVDQKLYNQRLDLITTGRTLFGAPAPKGQEMDDHYFGAIKDRVSAFMTELDLELWKMGITSKTKHNEVAPTQYEMAPVFTTANIATDHNQLVMETMEKVALRHGLVCLLHEKPYAGLNGSGKHNNWSLSTNDGIQLLNPGKTPHENEQFLLFFAAVIKAIDIHADLLRLSAANSGNDHRLGANEAPPAIVSIFVGDELNIILNNIALGKTGGSKGQNFLNVGVDTLPNLPKDNTDRNRTSPFAFTGNKFEFRMVPSSGSIADANMVLNTIMAEALDDLAGILENASDINKTCTSYIKDVMNNHGRVIFNGDGYSDGWVTEATKRGLPNIKSTTESAKALITDKAIKLFDKYKVLTKDELEARYEVTLEQYIMQINIEAKTALNMVQKLFVPATTRFGNDLAISISNIEKAGASATSQKKLLTTITKNLDAVDIKVDNLKVALTNEENHKDIFNQAMFVRNTIATLVESIRKNIDTLEEVTPKDLWPVPAYEDLLYKI